MSKFKAPTQALGAPKYPLKHEDNSWFFSSNVTDWHEAVKNPEARKKYKEKGLRAVKGGDKFGGKQKQVAFRKANDAIKLSKPIIWV